MRKIVREEIHRIRKTLTKNCIVCGASKYERCYDFEKVSVNPLQEDELAWLEYQVFANLHRIKRIDPSNYLVRAVEAILESVGEPNRFQKQFDFRSGEAEETK